MTNRMERIRMHRRGCCQTARGYSESSSLDAKDSWQLAAASDRQRPDRRETLSMRRSGPASALEPENLSVPRYTVQKALACERCVRSTGALQPRGAPFDSLARVRRPSSDQRLERGRKAAQAA